MEHMNVNLHIEELVLHGFPAGERQRIAAAMQQELGRLITEQGLHAGGGTQDLSVERVQGGSLRIVAGQKPHATGVQIARNVFRGLRQQTRTAQRGMGGPKQ